MARSDFNWIPFTHSFTANNPSFTKQFPIEGSHEPAQHHAIARQRALEAGRYMLRSTNTGISSVIGPDGSVVAVSPESEQHVLRAEVTPLKGSTPYVVWGDIAALLLAGLALLAALVTGRKAGEEKGGSTS